VSTTALVRRPANGVPISTSPMTPVELGDVLARSGFFADSRDAAQAAVKVMAGGEFGFGPVASMTGIYIVKGKVTVSANLMAAAVKAHPRYDYKVLKPHNDERCAIEFSDKETGETNISEFTIDDARKQGLESNDNYRKTPRNMLFARAMSNGVKWYCPDVLAGPVYTPADFGLSEDDPEADESVVAATEVATPPAAPVLPYGPVTDDDAQLRGAVDSVKEIAGQLPVDAEDFVLKMGEHFNGVPVAGITMLRGLSRAVVGARLEQARAVAQGTGAGPSSQEVYPEKEPGSAYRYQGD